MSRHYGFDGICDGCGCEIPKTKSGDSKMKTKGLIERKLANPEYRKRFEKEHEILKKEINKMPPKPVTHTATPWKYQVDKHDELKHIEITACDEIESYVARIGLQNSSEADAAFIVRAVNAHEELLGLLKATLNHMDDKSGGVLTSDIERAIALAESRPITEVTK